jgi:hypothetical protein
MGLILSLFQSAKKEVAEKLDGTHKAKLRTYNEVVDRMEQKETEIRVAAQANCCWLTFFYLQTIVAMCELPVRIVLHFCLKTIFASLACVPCFGYSPELYFNWWRQEMLFIVYAEILPGIIGDFCCSPCDDKEGGVSSRYPFGDTYRFNRPPNPKYTSQAKAAIMKQTMGLRSSCFCCCGCDSSASGLFTSVIGIPPPSSDATFFKWTLFAYGGLVACHPILCCPAFNQQSRNAQNGQNGINGERTPGGATTGVNSTDNTCGCCEGGTIRYRVSGL